MQGADSPKKNIEGQRNGGDTLKPHPPPPTQSKSPTPPATQDVATPEGEPIIQHGKTIFSMTSIDG